MGNRLIDETSPYLLQHANNPVNWYPWGPEALEKALREDKPILLSIGYSACHWCHVMEHESFENEQIAKLMNERFVNIKVDREERPDIDDIYMKALQLMTGHGGWPMTVFLTPALKPFFGGTYFPPEDKHGMPGFNRVLMSVATAWENNRKQIADSANELTSYLRSFDPVLRSTSGLTKKPLIKAAGAMIGTYDRQWGGFGNAPKFPLPANLSLALRLSQDKTLPSNSQKELLELVTITLDKMAYGGMHDQIGGGFARYSVDRKWLVPHFEKMLYDNATLSKTYFDAYLLTGRKYWSSVGKSCLDFVARELMTPQGAFFASLDADSEGEEGKFYVWTPEEVVQILGEEDGHFINEVYGITADGNVEFGRSVPHLVDSPETLSAQYGLTEEGFWERLHPLKERLLIERDKRTHPGRDEKVLTSWNGLMISGFVSAYKALQEKHYLTLARNAANFLLSELQHDGRLLRTYGKGKAKLNAYLDDYAFLVQALLDLCEIDYNPKWYHAAHTLTKTMLRHFWDDEHGGFFYTSDDHEALLTRPKNYFDGSTPSGTSVAVLNLIRLSRLSSDDEIFKQKAEETLSLFASHFERGTDQFSNLLIGLHLALSSDIQIAIVIDSSKDNYSELLKAAHSIYLPTSVIILKDIRATTSGDESSSASLDSPLVKSRGLVNGLPTAYVCSNFTCDQPITDPDTLRKKLSELAVHS